MFRAIHEGENPYSMSQRKAWLPEPYAGPDWAARLARQYVVVADGSSGPVGFMSLGEEGYVDLAFILPHARGRGVFRRLHDLVEARAVQTGLARLWTHASLMAQPAFAALGYRIEHHEKVRRGDEELARAKMSRELR